MAERGVTVELADRDGRPKARLRLWSLRDEPPLPGAPAKLGLNEVGRVRMVEATAYGYEVTDRDGGPISAVLEPRELFDPDRPGGGRGRLQTGNHAGMVVVVAKLGDGTLATASAEIATAKLRYDDEFRWMLRDITSDLAEAALARFGPTLGLYSPEQHGEPSTLYQRFAFLKAILESEDYRQALQLVLARPYTDWDESTSSRSTSGGVRASKAAIRAFSAGGPRRRLPVPIGALQSLPLAIPERSLRPRIDNVPNQFVRGVLEDWRGVAQATHEALLIPQKGGGATSAPILRGLEETARLVDELDAVLGSPVFRGVGRLTKTPAANQVLLRRAGYRELAKLYQQSQLASALTWDGADVVFGAGQRDVATLYEYWVFLQFGRVIADLCDGDFHFAGLFSVSQGRLQLTLKKRRTQVVSGSVSMCGIRLHLALWFNRSFRRSMGESWSRNMRPDLSLGIGVSEDAGPLERVWLHFDAKYRVERLAEILGEEEDDDEVAEEASSKTVETRRALREDLLKMHAYRDAIRRSSGAYVLYPGADDPTGDETFLEYYELLPGLGVFVMRPTESGPMRGSSALRAFIHDVLGQAADVLSDQKRALHWSNEVHGPPPVPPRVSPRPPRSIEGLWFLERPPEDESVVVFRMGAAGEFLQPDGLLVFRTDGPPGLPSCVFRAGWVLVVEGGNRVVLAELIGGGEVQQVPESSSVRGATLSVSVKAVDHIPPWLRAEPLLAFLGGEEYRGASWAELAALLA